MKKTLLSVLICTFFLSCKNKSQLQDLSGNYENIEDDNITKIEKLSDTEYVIYAPDGKDRITAIRSGNTLSATFNGSQISDEFNATCDTMTNKENGQIVFQSKKITE